MWTMTADQDGSHPLQRLGLLLAWHGSVTQTRMKRALSAAGLTPRHAMTLMHLEGGPISQRALAERLEVDPSVLVGILNDLEGDGLAERRRDQADRRRHNVAITSAGRPSSARRTPPSTRSRAASSRACRPRSATSCAASSAG